MDLSPEERERILVELKLLGATNDYSDHDDFWLSQIHRSWMEDYGYWRKKCKIK